MKKSVATKKDIQALPNLGQQHEQKANWSGKWTAGNITVETYKHFQIQDDPVVYKAECLFTFAGMDTTTNTSVTDTEKLTLEAKKTILQTESYGVLCDGDEVKGKKGNSLQVKSTNLLKID